MTDKLEVIYYEMVKMEDRITKKADAILEAESRIEKMIQKLEIIVSDLQKEAKRN